MKTVTGFTNKGFPFRMSVLKSLQEASVIVSETKNSKIFKMDEARRRKMRQFAEDIGVDPAKWTEIEVVAFVKNFADSHPNNDKGKPIESNTLFIYLNGAMKFATQRGSKRFKVGGNGRRLAKQSLKRIVQDRAMKYGEKINRYKQATILTRGELATVAAHFAAKPESKSVATRHRDRAARMALVFTHAAPIRVGDLFHTGWWSYTVRQDADGEYLNIRPAWLKNAPKANKAQAFKLYKNKLKVLCPVTLYKSLITDKEWVQISQGPFHAPEGKPYSTGSIVRTWQTGVDACAIGKHITGHSGKRGAITAMNDAGLELEDIRQKGNYAPTSQVPLIYDDNRQKRKKNEKKKEVETREQAKKRWQNYLKTLQ